ncbi:uncharacterized protein LOC114269962 [Camellia sinensis]|uniref:uncharacterized protein LOC114269962 n=1 Tax=Camellia sinensis TaxID=4442 RepID=UPI001036A618|nr:uncharacterized protein LOC114269962 [Camellia sinensis]
MERVQHKKSNNEGNRLIQRQRSLPKLASDYSSYSGGTTEEDLFSCELWTSSSRRVTGTPIKKLLAEEMSKETVSKRRPPSVIARLMGLDGLPPQQPLHRQHKGFSETYRQWTASLSSQRDGKPYERQSNRKDSMAQQECKDVYEVLETSNVERSSYPAKRTINSKLSEAEMAFIQQKFMAAKHLSTNDKLHNSKEFCDMLDMLDANKDLLMKFLQQPDSLFTKHLVDLQGVAPRSKRSHMADMDPSKLDKYESSTIGWKSEKGILQCSHRKHYDGLFTHFYNHRGAQKPLKSPNIQLEGKHESETNIHPTRIVVLKPNPEKMQNATKSVLSTSSFHGNQSDCRKHWEYRTIDTGEGGHWVKKNSSNDDAGFLRPKSREPKEKAKEITTKMRESLRGEPMDLPSIFKGYAGDESSYNVSASDSGSESELTISTLRKSFRWSNRPRPSSWHSTESSVSREAKKRLSERWKMSQRYQNFGVVGKASTLGQMLSIHDTEIRPENFYPMIGLDGSSDRFVSNDETAEWDSPLGISSRDGWKDSIRISSRSRSIAASYVGFGGPKTNMQRETLDQDSYLMAGEAMNRGKNKAIRRNSNKNEDSSSRKIKSNNKKSQSSHLTYSDSTDSFEEEQFNLSPVEINLGKKDPAEQKSLVSQMWTHNINCKSSINDAEADGGHADMYFESLDEELPSKPSSCLFGNPTSSIPGPEDSKAQVPQIGPSEEESVQLQCPVPEPQSPASSKEADHPSPVSVLEAPFVEDVNVISPGSECFERVNADLHGLRMQLKLLKMESGANANGLMLTPNDKDVGQGFVSVSEENEVFNDESWESFYLGDVLIDFGYDDADPYTFVSTWYSFDCPLDPCLFDNLEKKYSNETTPLRSERKLLFDRINSGLFEMFHQFVDPLPWVKVATRKVGLTWQKHGIGYELHKLLASEEKSMYEDVTERVLDREMQWLDFGYGVDAIGREIEKLLIDDLIVEVANM